MGFSKRKPIDPAIIAEEEKKNAEQCANYYYKKALATRTIIRKDLNILIGIMVYSESIRNLTTEEYRACTRKITDFLGIDHYKD